MTPNDAVNELNGLDIRDPECAHSDADNILLEYLKANGAERVAAAFEAASERIGFWYA